MNLSDYNKGLGLIFMRACMGLVDAEGDGWTLLCLLRDPWPRKREDLCLELNDFGYSDRSVGRGLTNLVRKGLARRIKRGWYRPIMGPILEQAIFIWRRDFKFDT